MKNNITHRIFLTTAIVFTAMAAFAQGHTIRVWQGGKDTTIASVDSITFVDDEKPQPQPTTGDYVDLGLSVKWATCNLGATTPEGIGNHYAWGETEPKNDYSWETYKFGPRTAFTKYNEDDGLTTLTAEDDAATVALGSDWRMPTIDELKELCTQCTWTKTTQNDVVGFLVTGPNGNSIFMPHAGRYQNKSLNYIGQYSYYWSSTLNSDYVQAGYIFFVSSGALSGNFSRCDGFSIRPVRNN